VHNPSANAEFGPQLSLALSEGPLGGSQASTTNALSGASTPSPTATGAVLALIATPVITPSALTGGADAAEGDSGSLALAASAVQFRSLASTATANAIAAADALWILNPPAAWIDGLLHQSGDVLKGLESWLAQTSPQPKTVGMGVALGQADPVQTPVANDPEDLGAAGTEAPQAAATSSGPLVSGSFWWGATAFLCVVWGALNGHKWLAARRARQDQAPALKQLQG